MELRIPTAGFPLLLLCILLTCVSLFSITSSQWHASCLWNATQSARVQQHTCNHPVVSVRKFDLSRVEKRPLRVLVTGGAGYIGSHMCLLLLSSPVNYEITVVDDFSRGNIFLLEQLNRSNTQKKKFVYHKLTLSRSYDQLVTILKDAQIELVIHFAGWAYASESVAFPLEYFENTVESTRVLLSAMKAANVSNFLYSSSSATYGDVEDVACEIPITEQTPQRPSSPYGLAKLQSEQVIKAFRHSSPGFSYAMLRYFNVVGADPGGVVGPLPKPALKKYGRIVDACFDSALSDKPVRIYGSDYPTKDGFAVRDFIHVSDIASAHMKVLLAVMTGGQQLIYNIGINQGFSVKEVLQACESVTNKTVRSELMPRRAGDPAVVIATSALLEQELGWAPKFRNFTEMLATAWRWRVMHGTRA